MKFLEWLETTNGRKIIVTDRISNGNRLLRRCNIEQHMDVRQTSCMTLLQIAKELVYAWTAFEEPGKVVTELEPESCVYLLEELIRTGGYQFVPKESMCVRTAETILRSLDQIRMNQVTEVFEKSREEKILELKRLSSQYESRLQEQNFYDEVLVLRKALWILEQIENKKELYLYLPWLYQVQMGYLEDMERTALEEDFWNHLLALAEMHAQKLEFFTDVDHAPSYRFFSAYGMANEVRYVIEDMLEKGHPFDQVNVLYTSNAYAPFIRSAFESRGIPCHFATGESVSSSPFVQLMLALVEFAKGDCLYSLMKPVMENPLLTFEHLSLNPEALENPLTCFNHYIRKGIGWGRERYLDCIRREESVEESKIKYEGYLQFLKDLMEIFGEDLSCGELYRRLLAFASRYTKNNMERNRILAAMKEGTMMFDQVSDGKTQKDCFLLIEEYFKDLTMKGTESEDASVQVMKIQNLEVLERPYQYVIGLSAKQFQADTTESPVLSDKELERYLEGVIRFAKDNGRRMVDNLSHSLDTLSKGEIVMGYTTFDTVELKESSPSVFYLNYEEKYAGEPKKHASYPMIKTAIKIPNQETEEKQEVKEENLQQKHEITMSPSALQTLIGCPLCYYYQYEMRIPKQEFQEKSAHQWLNPANRGNLFHRTMEEYGKKKLLRREVSEAEPYQDFFECVYQESLQQMLNEQAYSSEVIYLREAEENQQMIWKYLQEFMNELHADYQAGRKWRILGFEHSFEEVPFLVNAPEGATEELKILFKGSIDRLDAYLDEEGTLWLRVVDYKTGNTSKKRTEIIADEQIQHVVYVWAAHRYATENKAELESLFGRKIEAVKIYSAEYVFPHMTGEERMLDVDTVKEIQDRCGKVFEMASTVQDTLWKVFVERKYKQGHTNCQYCKYTRLCREKLGTEM